MSETHLRFDEWTDTWVTIAPGRRGIGATRPGGMPTEGARCPFCPGHESDAEEPTLVIGEPWRVRALPNRFPLVRTDAIEPSLERTSGARGAHEVIVEAREHDLDLATLSPARCLEVLLAWRSRAKALGALPGARALTLFRNKGRRAGSSQPHPHSQIVALPFVPPLVARRAEVAGRFSAKHGQSLATHTIARERALGTRVVSDERGIVTLCPFASSRAWAVRMLIEREVSRFADVSDEELAVLAARLPDACARALEASGATDYNVFVADPPLDAESGSFSIEILPRTGGDAGFELSTGASVCVVLPEDAARLMRELRPPAGAALP